MHSDKTALNNKEKKDFLLSEFYDSPAVVVSFSKAERDKVWNAFKKSRNVLDFEYINATVPAFYSELLKAISSGNNVQSAVFSECVYVKAFADSLSLSLYQENVSELSDEALALLRNHSMSPRYFYTNEEKSRILVHSVGSEAVDAALIDTEANSISLIEFKEPIAKASEIDLPKYQDDGKILVTEDFCERNPHYSVMVKEKEGMSIFENMGKNIRDFSQEGIETGVSENYTSAKKFAHVICTEDKQGRLTMFPADDVFRWIKPEGEIRTAGRNHVSVWTEKALDSFLRDMGAIIDKTNVILEKEKLVDAVARGGTEVSRFKINPLFFVYARNSRISGTKVYFDKKDVRQLIPTIAAKIIFKNLSFDKVKEHYQNLRE